MLNETKLTSREAYDAFVDLLWQWDQIGRVDFVDLTSALYVTEEGTPGDPAVVEMWQDSVNRILQGLPTRGTWAGEPYS